MFDEQHFVNSKSCTHKHEDSTIKSFKKTEYKALYLEVQKDYKKLNNVYLKIKKSYEESQYILKKWIIIT